MMIRNISFVKFIIYFLILISFLSCSHPKEKKEGDNKNSPEEISIKDITGSASEKADSILTEMTLEERVGQCIMPSLPSNIAPLILGKYMDYIENYHIGGIVLLEGTPAAAKELAEIGEMVKPPLFIAIDAEWGLGMRLKDAPVFPKNGNIDKEAGELSLFDYGVEIARQCRELGINMVLGPVVDVTSKSRNVIGKRSFGDNPDLVTDYSIAYAKGLEAGKIISVAKHFPGHGSSVTDSHYQTPQIFRDISQLDSIDLKPFRIYIESGLTAVMAGHIKVPALDPEGKVASVSKDILTNLLREELGFNGLIITDAFDMGGARGLTAIEALKAGADIILCPADVKKEYEDVLESVRSGNLDLQLINDRCRRVLFTKVLFGII